MTLGQRILQARQAAGLSQRQLCGDMITRNMLSQIEHDTARPSMDTLRYLAAKLELPVSWFLEEDGAVSSNQSVMEQARTAFDTGDYPRTLELLGQFRLPDPVYDRELRLLEALSLLGCGEAAAREDKKRYARELLERAATVGSDYCVPELQRRRLLLMDGLIPPEQIVAELPSLDGELLIRGEYALETGDAGRAAALLDSVEDQSGGRWNLLRGRAEMLRGEYRQALVYLHRGESLCPEEAVPYLERCFRELGDYQQAYHYACLQKK